MQPCRAEYEECAINPPQNSNSNSSFEEFQEYKSSENGREKSYRRAQSDDNGYSNRGGNSQNRNNKRRRVNMFG